MMQRYDGYWISGSAVPGPPYTTYWEALAVVLKGGHGSSIVEVTRLHLADFAIEIKEVAEWFGLEVARMIVEEYLPLRDSA